MPDPKQHLLGPLSRRRMIGLGLVAGASAALSACGQASSGPGVPAPTTSTQSSQPDSSPKAVTQPASQPATKRLADTIVFANNAMAASTDPQYSLSNSGFMMARQIYDALVTFDASGKIVPQLAHEWNQIDPLTMEFKLRDDVKFSNGEDFTAESVKWTVERLLNSSNPSHQATKNRMGPLAGAEVVNSTTVRLKTKEPDPILLNRLVSLFMLPPKYGQDAGDEGLARQGVGTGSYKVIEFVQGERIVLEAFEQSWRGPAKVKQARILQFSEDSAMIAALRTGEVDVLWRVEPDQVDSLKDQFNFRVQSYGSATAPALLQDTHPAMADRRVRQAINMAINKQEFIDRLLVGRAEPLQGQLIEKGILGYHEGLSPVPYDPDRAKALLAEAGYPNLSLTIGSSVGIRSIAEGIAGYLSNVGIDAKINVYESAVNTRNITQGTTDNIYMQNRDYFHTRDFDVHGVALALNPQPHFPNEEFKRLFLQSRSELDTEKRAALIRQMSELVYNEYGVLFMIIRHLISPHTKKIASIEPKFDTAIYLWEIEKEA